MVWRPIHLLSSLKLKNELKFKNPTLLFYSIYFRFFSQEERGVLPLEVGCALRECPRGHCGGGKIFGFFESFFSVVKFWSTIILSEREAMS